MNDMTIDDFFNRVEVFLRKHFTDEQKELAMDIRRSLISFSMPGSGKTATMILAIITAQVFHRIVGSRIWTMSYTNMATAELENRYIDYCNNMGIRSDNKHSAHFTTLHSKCTEILRKYKDRINLPNLTVSPPTKVKIIADYILSICEANDIMLEKNKVRLVVSAVTTLNNSLIFDRFHVESKMCFRKTKLSYDEFMLIRRDLYSFNRAQSIVATEDIMLYTLQLLLKNPDVAEEVKKSNDILVVDEVQDFSLLQLKLVSMMSNNVVAIGDIKQQIYAFNGACQEIVQKFFEFFPNAKQVNLTKSFRCSKAIVDYSKKIIAPNKLGGDDFTGTDVEGIVTIENSIDYDSVCKKIHDDFVLNNHTFPKSIMFLFRNNISAIPIGEALYKYRIPFRVNGYKLAHQIDVVCDLCAVVELIKCPHDISKLGILGKIIPEFRDYMWDYEKNPIAKIMRMKNIGFFDIRYNYHNGSVGEEVMSMLNKVKRMYKENIFCIEIFREIWRVYDKNYLEDNGYKLQNDPKFYMESVSSLIDHKTYDSFVRDELDKNEFIIKNKKSRSGIRCYTLHASKGLESDIGYILDANDGLIPSDKKLEDTIRAGCEVDAAREVRNERSLVFVGITRFREECHIIYRGRLSPIFIVGNKDYDDLDEIYSRHESDYSDVEVFGKFIDEVIELD